MEAPEVIFSIPTGAFGNGTAGLLAKLMGLPIFRYLVHKLQLIDRLLVATNENDILYQFFHKGIFERTEVVQTVSPSIDIQVPYNFERFLYYLTDGRIPISCVHFPGNSAQVKKWMEDFQKTGKLNLDSKLWESARSWMWGSSVGSKVNHWY